MEGYTEYCPVCGNHVSPVLMSVCKICGNVYCEDHEKDSRCPLCKKVCLSKKS